MLEKLEKIEILDTPKKQALFLIGCLFNEIIEKSSEYRNEYHMYTKNVNDYHIAVRYPNILMALAEKDIEGKHEAIRETLALMLIENNLTLVESTNNSENYYFYLGSGVGLAYLD